MNPNERKVYSFTYTVPTTDFTSLWRQMIDEQIEAAVAVQQERGFPEVKAILKRIAG